VHGDHLFLKHEAFNLNNTECIQEVCDCWDNNVNEKNRKIQKQPQKQGVEEEEEWLYNIQSNNCCKSLQWTKKNNQIVGAMFNISWWKPQCQ